MSLQLFGKTVVASGLFGSLLLTAGFIFWPQSSSALSGSSFQAGHIIDDVVFFDGDAMSASEIQDFLDSMMPACDTDGSEPSEYGGGTRAQWAAANNKPSPPYTCLKDYEAKVPDRSSDDWCSGSISSSGDTKKSAAYIISAVAKACDISPKVLLVTLQKEMGLVTDEWPWPTQYLKAMGYGCPDSDLPHSDDENDNGCYDDFEGFFRQVYNAARQFQRYVKDPNSFNHRAGETSRLLSYPNCKSSDVLIQNKATAALYNYTPYQPNSAALDNLDGTGSSCSYYGNRNFWRDYNYWFGSVRGTVRFIHCGDGKDYIVESHIYRKREVTDAAKTAWGLGDFAFGETKGCSYDSYSMPLAGTTLPDGVVIRSRDTNRVYLIDSAKAFRITSQSMADAWGIGNISDKNAFPMVQGETIGAILNDTGNLTRLARSTSGRVYLMDNAKLHCLNCVDPDNTTSIRLVQGDNRLPMQTYSGPDLISPLSNASGDSAHDTALYIDHSFVSHGHQYIFDYGKIHMVEDKYVSRWTIFDTSLPGPALSFDIRNALPKAPNFIIGFKNYGTYYFIHRDGSLHSTTSPRTARNWDVYTEPSISNTLKRKIVL